ncbi:MarR family transcriptional regulator [Acuticoccus sp. M5D2P5]|uniref:MarR family winged helix-turn-helix transcriptional regulator n=1 Tax=Acuticoccus kalidii TaxID=2910977 RepID=UPI001F446D4F|nr:MarR family transcriptional regulator [Acuticoccus kalidii]MCF3931877.1 MarR family transcriptional regulator [Acuticoccus kalidii]
MVDVKNSSAPDEELAFDLIERIFFGYRDFVGIADEALVKTGYGRAHHRVLHFVDRNPGLTVGELLAILKVTKQGVARVLRTLVDDGLIEVRPGEHDRREKRLSVTTTGHELAVELARLQTKRIETALAPLPEGSRAIVAAFLAGLVDDKERNAVLTRIQAGRS